MAEYETMIDKDYTVGIPFEICEALHLCEHDELVLRTEKNMIQIEINK